MKKEVKLNIGEKVLLRISFELNLLQKRIEDSICDKYNPNHEYSTRDFYPYKGIIIFSDEK